ncbi:prolyl oligopeptidase family serine peptidase [Motilimonas sp. E26]|uniref:prolyl oligopeptidase family serine peptidase n=1 Tax=Motilimonas sp. E26 TaxID=2865674 RepID=UPI001E3DE1BE|nr:prolyl oligopeptidase family serine peptidase [Motilimonas sp. E26]MCE0557146.1 prolyl oligopeptidase family serine peptidase [Motilimonas sp. E26]
MQSKIRYSFIAMALVFFTYSAWAENLLSARAGHVTVLNKQEKITEEMTQPPADIFNIIKYPTELGEMSAYLSQPKLATNEKRPAIIWLTGGFPTSSPGDYLWTEIDVDNEQSARVYRDYGIVMMFPTLRGGVKGNPGVVEQFYGEVNDVISAGKYLRSLDYIDPERVYLGGHSTGGTLALLVAEATDIFAGVISLGPTANHYGKKRANFVWNDKEIYLRSPNNFLSYITKPTYIIEGEFGNAGSIEDFQQRLQGKPNNKVKTALVKGANHFSVIHPVNSIFAQAIAGGELNVLSIDEKNELEPAYLSFAQQVQQTTDLRILANLRSQGLKLEGKQQVRSYFYARNKDSLVAVVAQAKAQGMLVTAISQEKSENGSTYFMTSLSKQIDITALQSLFELSHSFKQIADENELYYDYWTIGSK